MKEYQLLPGTSSDFRIWEPERGQNREDAVVYAGNTPKQAAIKFLEDDYNDDPRAPEERILEVERIYDGVRWVVHLEPRIMTTWGGVASVREKEQA